jgi:ATP-binding cassette subfamily C protein CydD
VVLLDEPTAHLDPESRRTVIRSIGRVADRGATVVVATQDESVVAAADRVVEVSSRAKGGDPAPDSRSSPSNRSRGRP